MSVAVASFLVFSASQVGTPGPANMALLATGARFGFRAAMPFVAGVVIGKQLVIWPVGFGLMELADRAPYVFDVRRWISAAYILCLAWKVANLRLSPAERAVAAPGFIAGLIVHPLNPKAWAMIVAGFTNFVSTGTPALQATLTIAICLLCLQMMLHPIRTLGGDRIARTFAGTPAERHLMRALALSTVASVLFVLFGGDST